MVHLLWQSGVAIDLDAGTVLIEIADNAPAPRPRISATPPKSTLPRTRSRRACIGLLLQFFRRILVREREQKKIGRAAASH
jgi:hypothetical protein